MKYLWLLAGCFAFLGTGAVNAEEIQGAGATFPEPLYKHWGSSFERQTGITLNYQGTGSGDGIRQIKAGSVAFGASDMPLDHDKLEQAGLYQFPTVVGGVAVVVNIAGLGSTLKLDGETLAGIFMGKITRWSDAAISVLNPGVSLPDVQINVIYRSDHSGSTFLFTHYLSATSPAWKSAMGSGVSVEWKTGKGCKGNMLIPICMLQNENSISYMDYAYAVKSSMKFVSLKNSSGNFVTPGPAGFRAAAAHAKWDAGKDGFHELLINKSGADTWPITGATYILMHAKQQKVIPAKHDKHAGHDMTHNNASVLKFFDWAYEKGGSIASEMGYVPLPAEVQKKIRASWSGSIKDAAGNPACYQNCTEAKPVVTVSGL